MKKVLYSSILIVIIVFVMSLTAKTIKAWLQDTQTTEEVSFTLGKVEYSWAGDLNDGPVVPGQNIIDSPFTLSNFSTIDSELRVKLSCDLQNINTCNLFSEIGLGDNWVLKDDGYFYYLNNENTKIAPDNKIITVLESLVLDGNVVNNSYADMHIGLSLHFEAKQADYVTWEELGNTNINLG